MSFPFSAFKPHFFFFLIFFCLGLFYLLNRNSITKVCLLYLYVSRFINYTLSLFQSMFYSFHFHIFFFFFFSLSLLRFSNSLSVTHFFVLDNHTIFFVFLLLVVVLSLRMSCFLFFTFIIFPHYPLSLFLWRVFSRFTLLLTVFTHVFLISF